MLFEATGAGRGCHLCLRPLRLLTPRSFVQVVPAVTSALLCFIILNRVVHEPVVGHRGLRTTAKTALFLKSFIFGATCYDGRLSVGMAWLSTSAID